MNRASPRRRRMDGQEIFVKRGCVEEPKNFEKVIGRAQRETTGAQRSKTGSQPL